MYRPSWERIIPIQYVAVRSGLSASALRFYEEKGLIAPEARTLPDQRRYERSILRRLAFIVYAQKAGFSLEEIGAMLAQLPQDRIPRDSAWADLSPAWITRIDQRIAELKRLRNSLTECIGCGCMTLRGCRFANPVDRAHRLGPGPRFWIADPPTRRKKPLE